LIFGTVLLISPKNVSAQETIVLPDVIVSADCVYVEVEIMGVGVGTLEVCQICVEGNCHTDYDFIF